MEKYIFELYRTYLTTFEIEADNQIEAIKKFNELGDSIYTEELNQCNVIDESVKGMIEDIPIYFRIMKDYKDSKNEQF